MLAKMPANLEMPEESEGAFRYRHRAEELRIIADETRDPKMREVLLGVAKDYEKMAETLQRIAARENPK
jgi:hypothetical protein